MSWSTKTTPWGASALLGAALWAVACTRTSPDTIAVVVDQSGETASIGTAVLEGVRTYVAMAKIQVRIVSYDDRNKPERARTIAYEIAADPKILAVIGHSSSGTTAAAAEIYGKYGIPLIMPVATMPSISEAAAGKGYRNLLRVIPTHDTQAITVADLLSRIVVGTPKVLLISDQSDYGKDLGRALEKAISNAKGTVLIRHILQPLPQDTLAPDLSEVLTRVGQYKPNVVVFAGYYTEGAFITRSLRSNAIEVPIVMTDGCFQRSFFDYSGDSLGKVYITFPAPDWKSLNARSRDIALAVENANMKADVSYAPFAADAVGLICAARERIPPSKLSPKSLGDVLRGEGFNYRGIVSDYTFNERGDWARGANYIYTPDAATRSFMQWSATQRQ